MNKIKVLFVVTRCMKSGPIQVINNIANYIDDSKFEIYLVTINQEDENRSLLSEMKNKYILTQFSISKIQAITGQYKEFLEYVECLAPDVIHSTGLIPDYIIGREFPEKQLIISHANDVADYEMQFGKIVGRFFSNWHINIMKNAKKVIACSKSLSEFYNREFSLPMEFIRNGIVVSESKTSSTAISRKKIGIKENSFLFIYTASFNNRKNHVFILKMFEKYKDEFKNCDLLLLGDGKNYKKLYNEFSGYTNIHFIGRVKNVEDYLNISDGFISPSKQEGMPMAVLEAMNCGLPYILSDIPQHREIYELNRNIGKLYKLDDEKDFVNKMKVIVNYKKAKLKEEIEKVVFDNFNAEKMSQNYQNVYERISNNVI